MRINIIQNNMILKQNDICTLTFTILFYFILKWFDNFAVVGRDKWIL